jgi:3-oxoacyl-[acyl-carrier protein] reductase
MGILDGKKVLITGGSRGIGAAIVRSAVEEGGDVVFSFRESAEQARRLAAEVSALRPGARCLAMSCDVADTAAMRELTKVVTLELGRIDVLVNNAGIVRDATLARMTRDRWDEVISTNLGSMFNATQPLMLQFVRQRSGCIINLTSVVGIFGNAGQTNYAAAKAGIIGFTKALAKEIGPFGVRVNAVAPGIVETDMTAAMNEEAMKAVKARISLGRLGAAQDVAQLVCFLASDRASYITGQVVQIDGGLAL